MAIQLVTTTTDTVTTVQYAKTVDGVHEIIWSYPLSDILGLITIAGLFITVAVSLRALRESTRANILTNLPIASISYDDHRNAIRLDNIGKGIMTDIKFIYASRFFTTRRLQDN